MKLIQCGVAIIWYAQMTPLLLPRGGCILDLRQEPVQ